MNLRRAIYSILFPTALLASATAAATDVQLTIENLAPEGGLYFTPFWVGFHDGSFDIYDRGAAASPGLERFAEDGDFGVLIEEFAGSGFDTVVLNPEGFEGAPIFDPGLRSVETFDLDPAANRYFSYGAMVLPSNDAFVANGNPQAHELFDENGEFVGPISFVIYGSDVLDAGTEVNTEEDAAFLNQTAADAGIVEDGTVQLHPGFNGSVANPSGTPVNILGGTIPPGTTIDPVRGDFTNGLVPLARITLQEPGTTLRVSVKNTSAEGGTFLTPVWLAYHDGSFDSFNVGDLASLGIERMAEDGDFAALQDEFAVADVGLDQLLLDPAGFPGAPLFDPGFSSSDVVQLDSAQNRYLSFAAMLLPSNDAFIANDNPMAYEIFDESGAFSGPLNIRVAGSNVWDAGTEANTESDAAFFDQTVPDAGEATTDPIVLHPGFNGSAGNPTATPQLFLGGTNGPGISFDETAADFTLPGAQIAEIRISELVDGGHSGTWYNPERDGHGLIIDVHKNQNGESRAAVSWYHYAADGSGDQLWLIGDGPVIGDTAIVDMVQTEGGIFGEAFDSQSVLRTPWGQLEIQFNSCTEAELSYSSVLGGFGSGTESLVRLTSGPAGFAGACQL